MNEKIFAKEEFIGLPINVNQCNDPSWIGKSGIIIDETKNMFIIKVKKKKVLKKESLNLNLNIMGIK